MEGNGKRLGSVILSAIIIVAMLGWLASATITKIEITAVIVHRSYLYLGYSS